MDITEKIRKNIRKAKKGKPREAASIGIIGIPDEQKEQQEEFMKRFKEKLDFSERMRFPERSKFPGKK